MDIVNVSLTCHFCLLFLSKVIFKLVVNLFLKEHQILKSTSSVLSSFLPYEKVTSAILSISSAATIIVSISATKIFVFTYLVNVMLKRQ